MSTLRVVIQHSPPSGSDRGGTAARPKSGEQLGETKQSSPTLHEESGEEEGWKRDLCHAICVNSWNDAKAIQDQNPTALIAVINDKGRTALLVAAMLGHACCWGSMLLHFCFNGQCLYIALDLLQRCEELLLVPKDEEGCWTPIHDITSLNTAILSRSKLVFWKRWIYNSEKGNAEFVLQVSNVIPEIFTSQTFLLCFSEALDNRQAEVFNLIHGLRFKNVVINSILGDSEDTMLHRAAKKAPDHILKRIDAPTLQMQKEPQWYKVRETLGLIF
ncbi:hypothetical protein K1719_018430 [Acacia pycnantha]|nr:hypothetical protein K1719_018430 [Acacia pycnantha]